MAGPADERNPVRPDQLGLDPVVALEVADLAEAEVDDFTSHVGQEVLPVADPDPDGEPRVRAEDAPEGRRDRDLCRIGPDGHAQLADVRALEEADLALEFRRVVEELPRALDDDPAVRRRDRAAALALEEPAAEAALQGLDAPAEGGLRQRYGRRSPPEVPVIRERYRVGELPEVRRILMHDTHHCMSINAFDVQNGDAEDPEIL